jgi:outer membrane protein TolC
VRPDLRARNAEIQRIEAARDLTRRLIVPNPTLRGIYEEESESAGNRDRIIGGGVSISLPVFDHKQAELTELAGLRSRAAHERAATLLAIKAEVRDAFRSYEAARETVRIFESEASGPVDESFRFIETAYREGKIDLLQLVVVQNDLVNAQVSYLESLRDYAEAAVALERAVGDVREEAEAP